MIYTPTTKFLASLVARRRDGSVQQYNFQSDGGVFVGSSTNCGLRLSGQDLSEIHCRVELDDGDIWVQDWMSKQGTMIDGNLIETKTLLEPGAVLCIGEYAITVQNNLHPFASPDSLPGESCASESRFDVQDRAVRNVHADAEVVAHESSTHELPDAMMEPRAAPEPIPFDFEADFFEEETFDRETVDLLRAEIAELQAALAQRDAELISGSNTNLPGGVVDSELSSAQAEPNDTVLSRLQELIDEAQRSDERVALLEEMLQASEEASRSEREERDQLEGWLGEIEKRIGQREEEHAAEINSLRSRVDETLAQRDQLQRKLHRASIQGVGSTHQEATLENLQQQNRQLQEQLDAAQKQNAVLAKRLEQSQASQDDALREERAAIAQERAKISRLRFELSNRLTGLEQLPKPENDLDRETALRLQTLRQHLREIHEEEKLQQVQQPSLAARVKKLWNRVEY